VDIKGLRSILAQRPGEFVVALITAATVVFIGVEQAIFLAIVLSLLEHVRRSYKPKNAVLVPDVTDGTTGLRSVPVTTSGQALPGLVIYRFSHSLFYANSELFSEEVSNLVKDAQPPVSWFCIDAAAVADVDWSAGATVRQVYASLKEKGIRLVFAEVIDEVYKDLERYGVVDLVGKDAFYATITAVEAAYQQTPAASEEAQ
jgi:MFS superfamily sulfate permease-like transporter